MDEDTTEGALPVEGTDAPSPAFPHHVGEGSLAAALMDWLEEPVHQRRFLAAIVPLRTNSCSFA